MEYSSSDLLTFLSPSVHALIRETLELKDNTVDVSYLDDQSLFDYDKIESIIPDQPSTPDEAYFQTSTRALSSAIHESGKFLRKLDLCEFRRQYSHYFSWTSDADIFTEGFQLLQDSQESRSIVCILLMSSVLERSLGNLVLLKRKHCPRLLKDLITTPELQEIIGSCNCKIIQTMFGPPISLNLRNLAWHGFLISGEIKSSLLYFILLLVASIGRTLLQRAISETLPRRPFTELYSANILHDHFLSQRLPGSSCFIDVVERSEFIPRQQRSLWTQAYDLYISQKYGYSVCLLLPLLENALRHKFSSINACPSRRLTAETSAFYTTFDEMLLPTQSDGSVNKLMEYLPTSIVDMLYDLLLFPHGPCLRDHISHGEICLRLITQRQNELVLTVATSLMIVYDRQSDTSSLHDPRSRKILASYTSLFHPVSRLKIKMTEITQAVQEFSVVHVSPDLDICDENQIMPWVKASSIYSEIIGQLRLLADSISTNSCLILAQEIKLYSVANPDIIVTSAKELQSYLESDLSLASLPREAWKAACKYTNKGASSSVTTTEIFTLMDHIADQCQRVERNIALSLLSKQSELKNRQLRSRQRETMKRMLSSLPILCVTLWSTLLLFEMLIHGALGSHQVQIKTHFTVTKNLKTMLQCWQKMSYFSQIDKNKWDDLVTSCLVCIRSATSYVNFLMTENL